MRSLLLALVVFSLAGSVQASPTCEDVFTHVFIEPKNDSSAQKTLSRLYETSEVLALGNPDHQSQTAFKVLIDFLALHGADPRLKTVSVELSSQLKDYLALASTQLPAATDDATVSAWMPYLQNEAEPKFIVEQVMPAVRALNAKRPNDPLIIVPIDSVTASRLFNFDMKFIISIDREVGTAANFECSVLNRWPQRKHVVIYQHAHVLKNLTAKGLQNGMEIEAPLSWADLLQQRNAKFAAGYNVVLLDERSGFNPSRAIDTTSPSLKLNADGFLKTYRGGTVDRTNDNAVIADAYIDMNPEPKRPRLP